MEERVYKVHEVYEKHNVTTEISGEVRDGWAPLVDELLCELRNLGWTGTVVAQVKEKFGMLRVYIDGLTDLQYQVVDKYEAMSGNTCEDCGKPGDRVSPTGWIRTLCPECEANWNNRKL